MQSGCMLNFGLFMDFSALARNVTARPEQGIENLPHPAPMQDVSLSPGVLTNENSARFGGRRAFHWNAV